MIIVDGEGEADKGEGGHCLSTMEEAMRMYALFSGCEGGAR